MRTRKHETKAKARADSATIANLTVLFIIALVMAGATMLINDVPELRRGLPENAWPPSAIARALTVPIAMTGMTDCRWYVVPIGLVMLMILVVAKPTLLSHNLSAAGTKVSGTWHVFANWWFECLVLVTIGVAMLSAWMNNTWGFSRGWIYVLIASSLWSVLLSRVVPPGQSRRALAIVLGTVAIASVLALWHRLALGEQFFELPIGPVTVTGGLGAVLFSGGITWTFCRLLLCPRRMTSREFALIIAVMMASIIALALTVFAARRASWVAIILALLIAGVVVIPKLSARKSRFGFAAVIVVAVVGGAAFVQQRYVAPRSEVRRGIEGRFQYWRYVVENLPKHPFLGIGPDTFVCYMTTENSIRHATQPKNYTGRVDYEAHNEWLQAICELGVLGGSSYLALPITAIVLALRKWRRQETQDRDECLPACAVCLAALVLYESTSINLRHPVISPFYWTLLGLLLAIIRPQAPANSVGNASRSGERDKGDKQRGVAWSVMLCRIVGVAFAFLIGTVTFADIRRGMAHEAGRVHQGESPAQALREFEIAMDRGGSRAWLSSHFDRAMLLTRQLTAASKTQSGASKELGRSTVEAWREIVNRCQGYPDAGYRLSEARLMNGDRIGAEKCLDDYLTSINPYDPQANMLRIYLGGQDAMENLFCVRRALFSSPMNSVLASIATRDLASPDVSVRWADLVHKAWQSSELSDDRKWIDPQAPETFRIEALRLAGEGELVQAAQVSRIAAEMYGNQIDHLSDLRRVNAPVADAWYIAARFLLESEPARYEDSYSLVQKAEQYAKLEIRVTGAESPNSLDLAPVALRNRTAETRQLLRFSAMMGMACGMSEIEIARRVNWSLSGEQHTIEEITAEKARLAADLTAIFDRLSPESRPAVMSKLKDLARKATPQSQ